MAINNLKRQNELLKKNRLAQSQMASDRLYLIS
jgi:hypothetical protein